MGLLSGCTSLPRARARACSPLEEESRQMSKGRREVGRRSVRGREACRPLSVPDKLECTASTSLPGSSTPQGRSFEVRTARDSESPADRVHAAPPRLRFSVLAPALPVEDSLRASARPSAHPPRTTCAARSCRPIALRRRPHRPISPSAHPPSQSQDARQDHQCQLCTSKRVDLAA